MTKRIVAVLVFSLAALPLHADFSSLVRAMDGHQGMKQVWIPFFGVARFLVRVVHPKGVHDVQLATFENAEHVDPRALHALLESKLERGFKPLVKVRSKREWSFIYARPSASGDRIELMILAHDDETVLVRVDVDPEIIGRELGEPRRAHHIASNR